MVFGPGGLDSIIHSPYWSENQLVSQHAQVSNLFMEGFSQDDVLVSFVMKGKFQTSPELALVSFCFFFYVLKARGSSSCI